MAAAPSPSSVPLERLSDLGPGGEGVVIAIEGEGPVVQRLMDLGFVPGTRVRVVRRAPLRDPTVYALRGAELALRSTEAARIRIRPLGDDAA